MSKERLEIDCEKDFFLIHASIMYVRTSSQKMTYLIGGLRSPERPISGLACGLGVRARTTSMSLFTLKDIICNPNLFS